MRELLPAVVVAPMAGGPSTAELVIGAGRAGAVGFLAAGYKTPAAVEDELRRVAAAGMPYGLNVFAPSPPVADLEAVERYRGLLQAEAERYEVELPSLRVADDDHFAAKVELAEAYRVPLVSFTFGSPDEVTVGRLRGAGCRVLVTVTDHREAARALAARPDALICQAGTAGGHSATTDPAAYRGAGTAAEVLGAVRRVAPDVPLIAAGGTASAGDVAALRAAGAAAVQCGTVFLLADEAGTRAAQRTAMLSGDHRETVVTRAFTGQPARALRNRFTDAYTAVAPVGYPAVHHLTAPIRAAAARRGDAGALNLWAGTGHRAARPAAVAALVDGLIPS